MREFNVISAPDYDAEIKVKGGKFNCFSTTYLKNTYPRGGCRILGEVTGSSGDKAIGSMQVGGNGYAVFPCGRHSRLLWRQAGYVQVGDDAYVAVLKSRLPLLILLLGALLALLLLLFSLMPQSGPAGPGAISPDRPLPPVDTGAEKLEGDTTEKPDVAPGGGSLSMIYMLDASLNLSTGDISIYFQNPNSSTHNVALDMYIVSGGKEYLVAQSDLLEAGFGLSNLKLMDSAPKLSEGIYAGLYRLHCYDAATGEEVPMAPEITGLNITVTK